MEGRIQRVLLSLLAPVLTPVLALGSVDAAGAELAELELEPLVVREPERRTVKVDDIDTENWEIGVFAGLLSVEDFGANPVVGVRLAYHVTEDFFLEAAYGRTTLGKTSFERLSGGPLILTDDQREMAYYNLSVGWNLFPGEAFLSRRWAFKGGVYAIAGVGSTEFGGDDRFTVNVGMGYRLIPTDWLAFHLDVRDHIFESDLLGTTEIRHNIEFSTGLTVFF